MSTEDISRFLFQPLKRYSGVRMQQGRVLLDSDWNENERIDSEEFRRTLIDIVCAKGSSNQGFRVLSPGLPPIAIYDFGYDNGSFFLGGWRFETETLDGLPETFLQQPDWLQIDAVSGTLPQLPTLTGTQVRHDLVYLRGWEQCVTPVEDRELLEQALGGPDTSVRVRRMRRVEVLTDVSSTCPEAFSTLQQALSAPIAPDVGGSHLFDETSGELRSKAQLTITPDPNGLTEDPCKPAIASGYLGADNQTLRVQLTATNRFIWGYDNAAPLYRVQVTNISGVADGERRQIKFLTLPRDQMAHPLAGQAVELIPWGAILPNQEKVAEFQGQYFTIVTSYDPEDNSLTLAQPVPQAWLDWLSSHAEYWSDRDPSDLQQYLYLRLWTGGSGDASTPDRPFTPGTAVPLTGTGLSVSFSDYGLPGDFWVAAARPHTPDIVVPWELLDQAPPAGPRVFFAPLALIHWSLNDNGELQAAVHDCRERFQSLCQARGCCTVRVGDGLHSQGDFNSIEEALDDLPPEGGRICLLPGIHRTNTVIQNRQYIRITGCGVHTIVQPRPEQPNDPIFRIEASRFIQLDDMTLMTNTGTAIQLIDPPMTKVASQGLSVLRNQIVALIHAVEVRVRNAQAGDNDIWIGDNKIAMLDSPQGDVAIFSNADQVLIENNQIVVVPPPSGDRPNDPRQPDDPSISVFDPCAQAGAAYEANFPIRQFIYSTFQYVAFAVISALLERILYQTKSGIQIAGGSEAVTIRHNRIVGGRGNGITLGDLPAIAEADGVLGRAIAYDRLPERILNPLRRAFNSTLYDIVIEENTIHSMGLAGVGVEAFFSLVEVGLLIRVEDLTLYRNTITHCAQQIPNDLPESMLGDLGFGGIVLMDCENAIIQENRIESNGINHLNPICGILILMGEKVDISGNRILDNGPRTSLTNVNVRQGLRGGIVVSMSFKPRSSKLINDNELLSPDGIPAVKIHDNIVTQSLGQALLLLAMGPISIVGNQLTAQGADFRVNPLSLLAGTIYILNLGISQDLLALLLLASFRNLAAQNNQALQANYRPDVANAVRQLLYLPSGLVLFANNQVTLDLRTDDINLAFSSILIASLDDVAFNSNQSNCNSFIDVILFDTVLFAVTVRSNDNRFQEGISMTFYSLFSYGFMNTATGNQSTHCLHVLGGLVAEADNRVLLPFNCREDNLQFKQRFGGTTTRAPV